MFTTTIAKSQNLNAFINQLNDFCNWLISLGSDGLSLSLLAEQICRCFRIEYCSIHISQAGKWHHLSGNFAGDFRVQLPDALKTGDDHPFSALELAEEQMLNVRNFPVRLAHDSAGLFVVRNDLLPNESLQVIAGVIALFLKGTTKN